MKTHTRAAFLTALALLCSFLLAEAGEATGFDPTKTLKDYAGTTIIGSKINYEWADRVIIGKDKNQIAQLHLAHCTGAQPVCYPRWSGSWPDKKPENIAQIEFRTDRFDPLVNWGITHNQTMLHHVLIAPNFYFPDWFAHSTYSAEELDALLKIYITAMMTSNDNGSKLAGWNVINELLTYSGDGRYRKDGPGRNDSVWMRLGFEEDASGLTGKAKVNARHPIVLRKALEYASIASGKLEIRETSVAEVNQKSDALYQMIRHLQNTGVRVDAIGFQCHLEVGRTYDWDSVKRNIRRFHDLDLEVYITELDIGMPWKWKEGQALPATYDSLQARLMYTFIKTVREARVERIDTWGLSDGVERTWRKGQKALLFDDTFQRKKIYQAYLKALFDTMDSSESVGVATP